MYIVFLLNYLVASVLSDVYQLIKSTGNHIHNPIYFGNVMYVSTFFFNAEVSL